MLTTTRAMVLIESSMIQTIRQRRDYFLNALMFKAIHGLTPHYLCNDVTMIVDVSPLRCVCCELWPLLLTWFNFNPSMDK